MKSLIAALIIIIALPCVAQEIVPADSLQTQIQYRLDLAKYYQEKQEYEWVLTALRDSLLENVHNDSIHYLRGLAYGELGNWNRAVEELSMVLLHSQTDSMKTIVKPMYCQYVQKLEPATAIEKLTQLLQQEHNLDADFMITIGAIYEQNQLYAEANDVYITLLADTIAVDTTAVLLKLVTNDTKLKDYRSMQEHLQPLASKADSTLLPHITLMQAQAELGLEDYAAAEALLLSLYKTQPAQLETNEIRKLLANTYRAMGDKVLAWYFLEEMVHSSTKAEQYFLLNEIDALKHEIASDSLSEDQFKYLRFRHPLTDQPTNQ